MFRHLAFPSIILVLGVLLLSGCAAYHATSPNYLAGNFMFEQRNYPAAIENFRKELARHPDNWQAREKLGVSYYKTGQYDKAVSELERVLQHTPGKPRPSFYLGLALLKTEERSKAIEVFKSYRNPRKPLAEQEMKRQLTLLEISDGIQMAKKAVADEERLKTLPPKAGTVAVFYLQP